MCGPPPIPSNGGQKNLHNTSNLGIANTILKTIKEV
jgi:hypothetical protein